MKKRSICLLPKITSVGGPATFQKRFIDQAAKMGIPVHFDPNRDDIGAFLVIGAPRRYLLRLVLARLQNIPVVQRLNGMNWLHRARKSGLRYSLNAELANFSIAFVRRFIASGIIYQSPFCENRWNEVYGKLKKSSEVIYNGVNLEEFKPSGVRMDDSLIRIMTVEGNLEHGAELGLETAMRLVLTLHEKKGRPILLQVAGNVDPAAQQWILEKAQGFPDDVRIAFLGVVSKQKLAALEAEATFFYSAEIQTACPNAVLEALSCGLPVIGFDTGALKDVVGEAGVIVPYGADFQKLEAPDVAPLVAAAEQVIGENDRFRMAARDRAERVFPIEKITAAYVNFCLSDSK